MEGNQLGLQVKGDIKDYPHFNFVDDKLAEGSSKQINLSQFNVFIQFKQACIDENLIQNFDYFDDYYLLKFCRARNFKLEKVIKMFRKFIKWRKEEEIEIIENFYYQDLEDVLKVFPHGFHKVDKKGHPIYYLLINKLNVDKLFEVTTQDKLIKYFIQTFENMMKYKFKACSKERGELIESCLIIMDIEGIGVTDLFGKTKNFLKLISKLGEDYYPCNMEKMFLIKTGKLFGIVYNIIKGLIDNGTVEKVELLGNNYQEKIFEYIDPENLPQILGGTCTCPQTPGGCLYCDIGPWNPEGKKIRYKEKKEEDSYL